MDPFLLIGHSKRTEAVPHWMHQATLSNLKKPCRNGDYYEGHVFDIGRSRQHIAEIFMSLPFATHLLFVDDDIVAPHRDCLVGMFNFLEKSNEYIVSGLFLEKPLSTVKCPTCNVPKHRPLILAMSEREGALQFGFPYADKPVPSKSLIKVGALPAGFLLIKREVFAKIPKPWFVYGDPGLTSGDQPVGEDIYFSLKARKAGFKLWVDTRASLLHYVPGFVGLPEDLPFVQTGSKDLPGEVEAFKVEYQDELKRHQSGTAPQQS